MTMPRPTASTEQPELICSSRGCRAEATWGLCWNNPRLHAPDRRKVWLTCDDHRAHLEGYLSTRGLFRDTVAVGDLEPGDG